MTTPPSSQILMTTAVQYIPAYLAFLQEERQRQEKLLATLKSASPPPDASTSTDATRDAPAPTPPAAHLPLTWLNSDPPRDKAIPPPAHAGTGAEARTPHTAERPQKEGPAATTETTEQAAENPASTHAPFVPPPPTDGFF